MKRIFLVILIGCWSAFVSAQLSPKERKAVQDALFAATLSESDLSFGKQFTFAPLTLPLTKSALENPLEGVDSVMAIHAKAEGGLSTLIRTALEEGFGETITPVTGLTVLSIPETVAIPESLRDAVTEIVAAQISANAAIRDAVAKLTPEERRKLIESLPQWAVLGTDIKFDFVKQPRVFKSELYALLAKVQLARIHNAAYDLTKSVEDTLPKLREAIKSGWKGSVTFNLAGISVELSGVGDEVHNSKSSTLCIDLGGQNTYSGRYGAGIGYSGVLIDFGNKTKADGPDASFGAGILGIGVALFLGPQPKLDTESITLGAGLGGVGVAQIAQSTTTSSKSISQGVGVFGIGLLLASKGNDQYSVGYLGQGAAVGGGFGWLVNPSGDDQYEAGNLVIASDERGTDLSRSQGFAGVLPGGIGLLTDNDGNDKYDAGVDSQGSAITLGIGSFYDLKGNDRYTSSSNSQGFATQNGCASLFDLAGNDLYISQFGQSFATATHGSAAILVDRSGDDSFISGNCSPASAVDTSYSLFIDAAGSNRYTGTPCQNALNSFSTFIDLGSNSSQAILSTKNSIKVSQNTSVQLFASDSGNASVKPAQEMGSLSASETEIDGWWNLVCRNGTRSERAAKQLYRVGQPALERFCKEFAESANDTACAVASAIASESKSSGTLIAKSAEKASPIELKSLFTIARLAKLTSLRAVTGSALQNDQTRVAALKYAAFLKASDLIDPISGLVLGGDAYTSQEAVLTLVEIGDVKLVSTMEALLGSKNAIVRSAAIKFIARYPRGTELAKSLMSQSDERAQLNGVEMMSQLEDPDALRLTGAGLNSGFLGVRIKSMNLLNGRVPAAYKPRIIELMNDTNPVVAMVARGVDLGK